MKDRLLTVGKTLVGMLVVLLIFMGAILVIALIATAAQNAPGWVDSAGKVLYIIVSVLLLGGVWILGGLEVRDKIFQRRNDG